VQKSAENGTSEIKSLRYNHQHHHCIVLFLTTIPTTTEAKSAACKGKMVAHSRMQDSCGS
jgi:hypothetical protein